MKIDVGNNHSFLEFLTIYSLLFSICPSEHAVVSALLLPRLVLQECANSIFYDFLKFFISHIWPAKLIIETAWTILTFFLYIFLLYCGIPGVKMLKKRN